MASLRSHNEFLFTEILHNSVWLARPGPSMLSSAPQMESLGRRYYHEPQLTGEESKVLRQEPRCKSPPFERLSKENRLQG